jgi:hypothetical protein
MNRSLLGIYLNDHLAGSTAWVELARRLARREGEWAGGGRLERLAEEIEQDRAALLEMMAALGEPVRHAELWVAWLGAKLGRVKLNGRVIARSPLSRLVELEVMRLGVEGKVAGWRTLRARAAADARLDVEKLDELIASGRSQSTRLERLRTRAAAELFGAGDNGTVG